MNHIHANPHRLTARMQAAVFHGNREIRLEALLPPVPRHDEVLIRVRSAGICGGDLKAYRRARPPSRDPWIGGHELAGEIVGLGPGVTNAQPGQRVAIEPTLGCGQCPACQDGDDNLCRHLQVIGSPVRGGGGFAEYVVVPRHKMYPLPDPVSFEAGALVEVYAVAAHALSRIPASPADHVVVIGSGPVGLAIAHMAALGGAGAVAVVGKPDPPLRIAADRFGCFTVNADEEDPVARVREWTGGRGASVVFEAVGGEETTLQQALAMTRPRGRVGKVGGHVPPLTIDEAPARDGELTLSWCYAYGRGNGKRDFQIVIDLMASGQLDPLPLITHRFPLDQVRQAFAVAENKQESGAVKVLLLPGGD